MTTQVRLLGFSLVAEFTLNAEGRVQSSLRTR
jgi:hypothetical protein